MIARKRLPQNSVSPLSISAVGIPCLTICLSRGEIFSWPPSWPLAENHRLQNELIIRNSDRDPRAAYLRPQAPAGYWTRRYTISCTLGEAEVIRDWTAEGLLELVQFVLAEIEMGYRRRRMHTRDWISVVGLPLPSAQEAVEILQAGATAVRSPNAHLYDQAMTLEKVIYLKRIENKTKQWLALPPGDRPDRLTILPPQNAQFLGGRATELPENIRDRIISLSVPSQHSSRFLEAVKTAAPSTLQHYMRTHAPVGNRGGLDKYITMMYLGACEYRPLAEVFSSYSHEFLEDSRQTSIGWRGMTIHNWKQVLPSVVEAAVGPAVRRTMLHNQPICDGES